jgi:hypothetical protein
MGLTLIGAVVPALEVTAQLLIQNAGSDLRQLASARWGPPHLLIFIKPPADHFG